MSETGKVVAVCLAERRGTEKRPVDQGLLVRGHGLEGDAHAGTWHRQISLLGDEQIAVMRAPGLELGPGAFGENLVTRGIDLDRLDVGRRLRVGSDAVLQLTQRGKECHTRCRIYEAVGDCIMPRAGLFARVLRNGWVRPGDPVVLDPDLERLRWAAVTVADADPAFDSGLDGTVCGLLAAALGGPPVARLRSPGDLERLTAELCHLCDDELCDLVVTAGSHGLGPRDAAPEATLAVIDRDIPDLAGVMRALEESCAPQAEPSRAMAGRRGQSIIVSLVGTPRDVQAQLGAILPVLPLAVASVSGRPARREHGAAASSPAGS